MSQPEEAWVTVARLLRPQGRHGELLAELLTDFPETLTGGRELQLLPAAPSDAPATPIQVTGSWLPTGRNQGRVVLRLAGVESISAAEALAGAEVVVARQSRVPLQDDSLYVSDLLGLRVYDGDQMLGTVEDVSFPLTPDGKRRLPDATPLLAVRSAEGAEILIPFVRAFLVGIEPATGVLRMKLPPGIADLNAAENP